MIYLSQICFINHQKLNVISLNSMLKYTYYLPYEIKHDDVENYYVYMLYTT